MGELLNFSDIEFLEYFCRYGNVTLLAITGVILAAVGLNQALTARGKK